MKELKNIQQFNRLGKLVRVFPTIRNIIDEYGEDVIDRRKINSSISGKNRTLDSYWVKENVTEEEFQKQKIVSVIEQSDIYGKKIKMFWSEYDIERKLGISRANISSATLGKSKTAGKYIWTRMKMSLYELNQYLADNNITF